MLSAESGVVLGKENGEFWHRRIFNLRADPFRDQVDRLASQGVHREAEHFIRIIRIAVGRNEIERNLVRYAKADKRLDPFRSGSRRSADAEPRINSLNRTSS